MKYYATFDKIGESDIIVFHSEQERNDWVNFRDEYSISLGASVENSSFERIPLSARIAEKRIKTMLHKKDEFNDKQEWYYVKGN